MGTPKCGILLSMSLDNMGISQKVAATMLGCSEATVSMVISNQLRAGTELAQSLEYLTGFRKEMFLYL